ncbi:MAG: hypothetical protein HAW62_01185 [Endozoicomonadaceae bacterium]|nr:hypothetical protein [Endozoicomonadaceae bacterium]
MRIVFLFFISLAIAYGLAKIFVLHSGYILLSWGPYTLESSLLSIVLCILILSLSLVCLLRLCQFIASSFNYMYPLSLWAKKKKIRDKTNQAMQYYVAEQWHSVLHLLASYIKKEKASLLMCVLTAASAQKVKDLDLLACCFSDTYDKKFAGDWLFDLMKARWFYEDNQLDKALFMLKILHHRLPDSIYILRLLVIGYQKTENIEALKKLLPVLQRESKWLKSDYQALQSWIYERILYQAYEFAKQAVDKRSGLMHMKSIWKQAGSVIQKLDFFIENYAGYLIKLAYFDEADVFIRKQLERTYQFKLVVLYTKLTALDPVYLLKSLKNILTRYPYEVELLFSISKMSMKCRLWSEAEQYASQVIQARPSQKAYALMGEIFSVQGFYKKSVYYFEKSIFF